MIEISSHILDFLGSRRVPHLGQNSIYKDILFLPKITQLISLMKGFKHNISLFQEQSSCLFFCCDLRKWLKQIGNLFIAFYLFKERAKIDKRKRGKCTVKD